MTLPVGSAGCLEVAERIALDRFCSLLGAESSDEWLLRMRFHRYDARRARRAYVNDLFIRRRVYITHELHFAFVCCYHLRTCSFCGQYCCFFVS